MTYTDANAIGLTQNFYQVARLDPDTLNNGIPYWWALTYGLDPLDPDLATEDPAGDEINNLQKYQYGLNPLTSNSVNVLVNNGSVWATNQTITVDPSGFPFPFLKVSLSPFMSNATVLANTGAPLIYALPSASNITYRLFLQYTDASTNALGPLLYKPVTLDTIPPWVEITSPTNGTGDQAFIHLQATVYDPDPQNPDAPGVFRPVQVWINGQQYWNLARTQIDIPRFPVLPNTNNVITILAQDRAGNQSQAWVNWYVDTSTATNAPQLSFTTLQTNAVTILPNLSQFWVSGQMDNPNAIVTATVNGGAPITMTVQSNQFGYLLPLNSGTNTVVVMGSDAAGNVSSNVFTLVNSDSYQLAVTSPAPFGTYANGQPQVVSGYVSEWRDVGLPTQTGVVSVTVNEVGTTLTTNGDGTVSFTTTNAVAVSTNGLPTVLNVAVTWADGATDPPVGLLEGDFIVSVYSQEDDSETLSDDPCSWDLAGYSATNLYFFAVGEEIVQYQYATVLFDCNGDATPVDEQDSTNSDWSPQPSWSGLNFGDTCGTSYISTPGADSTVQLLTTWDGDLTFLAPWSYAADTPVEVSFGGVYYASATTPDMSQVTFQGQSPIAWSWDDDFGGAVSYLLKMSPGTACTISSGSFGSPGGINSVTTSNYPDGSYSVETDDDDSFSFRGFACTVVTIQVSPNPIAVCIGDTVTFTASGAPGILTYSWSASGGTIVSTSGSKNESAQIAFTTAGNAAVTATAGPLLTATAKGTATEVASLVADQGQMVGGITDIVDWASSGVVTVTATPNPNASPANLPVCWQMGGGTAVSPTVQTVDKSVPGFTTIVASAGTSAQTVVVAVVRCDFTALARCGAPSSDGFGAPFLGHAWWNLTIQPGAAVTLLGGDPNTGPQAYVNQDVGYACGTCANLPPSCQGQGVMWLDGLNGAPTDFALYTWDITYSAFAVGAQATATLGNNTGTYNCLSRNCVEEAQVIADAVGEYIPITDQPCTVATYLQQLNGY